MEIRSLIASLAGALSVLCFHATALADEPQLTDEQRSAVKQNQNPVTSASLRLAEQDMRWWRDAKFGMFIHWGLYAIPAEGEWYMHNKKVPADEYARLAEQFVGAKFDGDAWAAAARSAGMKYMVMVARHHDGFALWDSPSSYRDFTSVKTAARRDFVREYIEAARRARMRVGIYYSPMDWRFPGYFHPKEMPENTALMKKQGYGQMRELMGNYGPIDILWYDGGWLAHRGSDADAAWFWEPIKLNTMVRELQPRVVISPRSGWEGDFRCEEGGGEIKGPIRTYAWEKCLSMHDAWGYVKDRPPLSLKRILTHLVNAACRDGNLLMNVGPDPDGVIPPAHVDRLRQVGAWLEKYGSSIYGTRGGPFQPTDRVFGATCRDNVIYVHILSWPAEVLKLPPIEPRIVGSRCLNGAEVTVTQAANGIEIRVNPDARDEVVMIVELTLDGAAANIAAMIGMKCLSSTTTAAE